MRRLQIFILCFSFFFVFDSVSFSQRYKFREHGISFFIPDDFFCKITKKDKDINIFCKNKQENIFFGLAKNTPPYVVDLLYKINEDDYENADLLLEACLDMFNNMMKIKNYTIAPIFNINMILCNTYMTVKTLDIKAYRYGFFALGVTNELSTVIITMNAKPDTDEKKAIKNYENFKNKYFKEVITGIVFY